MNILVNGSCFNRGGLHGEHPGWVDLFQECSGHDVDNFSLRGAGYTYTLETTINILSRKRYDAVIIVWPQLYKTDIRISNSENFPLKEKTSDYVSKQTERASNIAGIKNVDHRKFEKNWVFNNTATLHSEPHPEWFKFLNHIDYKTMAESNLLKVYILQQFLKSLNIPFLFYFGKRSILALNYQKENQLFDESVVDMKNNFVNVCRNFKSFDRKNWRAGFRGHEAFSKIVQPRLDELLEHRI